MRLSPLPIDARIPELLAALEARRGLVLTAEPGTGKTTRLPPALSDALAGQGQVLVLEPRRLAVRLAAKRVAEERGLRLGEEVGYQVRLERVASPRTRLLYVTEGVLTRRLADERGGLDGVAAVVLDELHERHVDTDLALALLERLRRTRRPDLRVVAMSATLEAEPVAKFLDAAQVHVEAPHHPVEVEHAPTRDDRPLEDRVKDALEGLLERDLRGHVLVFLPGTAEIGRCERALEGLARRADLRLFPLHGRLEPDATEAALRPGGSRKVLLATNVAESSVTIDGVSAVIDSGLARVPGLSAAGLETLELQPISQASAKQRAGRAGRQGPGRCVRLYSKADHDRRPRTATPELLRTDLAPVALSLRGAGVADLSEVRWLDAPPAQALAAADELLVKLGAAPAPGSAEALTPLGRELLRFPLHPRHARVLVEGARRGIGRAAAAAVALLAEGDPRARAPGPPRQADVEGPSDVLHLLDLLAEADAAGGRAHRVRDLGLHPPGVDAVRRTFKQLVGLLPRAGGEDDEVLGRVRDDEEKLAIALLAGHPDRVARRQGPRTFVLAAGGHVEQATESVVRDSPWVVVLDATDLKRGGTAPRAHLVSAIRPEWLVDLFPEQLAEVRGARWNADLERVDASWRLVYGDLAVEESTEPGDAAEVEAVLLKAATQKGLQAFCDAPALDAFLRRLTFARSLDPSIPEAGPAEVEAALAALCSGRRSFKELRAADLLNTLRATLDPRGQLARLAPTHITLGGRRCEVNYEMRQPPWIASRLQDFFGLTDGPAVGAGKVKLVLHLLAPNKQAVNITSDLAGFWERHYPAARRELGRRYPRHSWPEDPTTATPPPPKGHRPR